jgi:hypothetical protein
VEPNQAEPFQPEPLAPMTGYEVPYLAQPGHDPLVSADYSGWWQRGIAIVKAGWPQLAAAQAIGAAVQMLVQVPLLIYVSTQGQHFADAQQAGRAPDTGPLFAVFGFTLLVAFAGLVVGAVVAIATMQMGVSIASGGQPKLGPALRAALQRAFPLIGWQFLAGLIMLVGLCACVLPIFYFLAVFTLMPAIVAFERTNAISRCFKLFHANLGGAIGRIATILGISILGGIIAAAISEVIGAAGGAPAFGMPTTATVSTSAVVVAAIVSALIGAVIDRGIAVLTGPLTLTAYADLRARVEPLTTDVLLREIGAPNQST